MRASVPHMLIPEGSSRGIRPQSQPSSRLSRDAFALSSSWDLSLAIVHSYAAFAGFNDRPGRLLRLLPEDIQDDDRILINPVDDTPRSIPIRDAQFVAFPPDRGHRTRPWHREQLPLLQFPEQVSRLLPCCGRQRRSLDLPVQPHKRFVGSSHRIHDMSFLT